MLSSLLQHPMCRGCDIDAPETTALRRQIVQSKGFLRHIYKEWYDGLKDSIATAGPGEVLEIGSGGGFFKACLPDVITSEVFPVPGVDRVVDAHDLPFADGALRAIAMTNVFHHLPDVPRFLREAARCVRPGGALVMVEPWNTAWSRLVYRRLHHEPFRPDAADWTFPSTGPLSGANGALPWIVFARDRAQLERDYPQWRVEAVAPIMPFRYLLSGGVSLRSLMPAFTFPVWRAVERLLTPWRHYLAMFARIVVRRTAAAS